MNKDARVRLTSSYHTDQEERNVHGSVRPGDYSIRSSFFVFFFFSWISAGAENTSISAIGVGIGCEYVHQEEELGDLVVSLFAEESCLSRLFFLFIVTEVVEEAFFSSSELLPQSQLALHSLSPSNTHVYVSCPPRTSSVHILYIHLWSLSHMAAIPLMHLYKLRLHVCLKI